MQESNRTVLLEWEEDVLKIEIGEIVMEIKNAGTYCLVDHEPMQGFLALELLAQLELSLLVGLEDLVLGSSVTQIRLTIHLINKTNSGTDFSLGKWFIPPRFV